VWICCEKRECLHRAPVALAPAIIRWGPDASSDMLRRRVRCLKCGSKGATLQVPGWVNREVGIRPLPVECMVQEGAERERQEHR
jgi:hypothetical protein